MSHDQTNRLFLTNNYSIVSKYSAIKIGYFKDENLEELIENYLLCKSWRRTPIVNRGYAARLLAMDWIVDRSISTDSTDCFIILGAGYDTLAFRKQDRCCWIELDLPQVVDVKSKFIVERNILKNDDLFERESGMFSSTSRRYHLISCDLRDADNLTKALRSVFHCMREHGLKPVNFALINEVCLCYIETNHIKRLLATVMESVIKVAHKIQYIGYEQVKPEKESQFSSIMLDHFNSLGHPIKHYPTPMQVHQLLEEDLGFRQVEVESMYKIYHDDLNHVKKDYKGFREEPFDEYEEMDLYLSHYALVTGTFLTEAQYTSGSNRSDISARDNEKLDNSTRSRSIEQLRKVQSQIQRFGHSSCLLSDGRIVSSGGFGMSPTTSPSICGDQKHRRLSDCIALLEDQRDSMKVQQLDINSVVSESLHLNRMHGQICEVSENLLFFNGGRQSPSKYSPGNAPFVALVDDTQMLVKHKFDFEAIKSTLRWRHRVIGVKEGILQLGGDTIQSTTSGIDDGCAFIWNFSSDKLGFREALDHPLLFRHSFALDKKDSNTLLIFGGMNILKHNAISKDCPMESSTAVLLWDLREGKPTKQSVSESARCYGANIHFIEENLFIKVGGISASDGLACGIELFDLRRLEQPCAEFPVPVTEKEPMILINATTIHKKSEKKIVTIGGGGNYFTFGTTFNKSHLVFEY